MLPAKIKASSKQINNKKRKEKKKRRNFFRQYRVLAKKYIFQKKDSVFPTNLNVLLLQIIWNKRSLKIAIFFFFVLSLHVPFFFFFFSSSSSI